MRNQPWHSSRTGRVVFHKTLDSSEGIFLWKNALHSDMFQYERSLAHCWWRGKKKGPTRTLNGALTAARVLREFLSHMFSQQPITWTLYFDVFPETMINLWVLISIGFHPIFAGSDMQMKKKNLSYFWQKNKRKMIADIRAYFKRRNQTAKINKNTAS